MFNWKSINGFGGLAGGVGVVTVKGWLGGKLITERDFTDMRETVK